ncbi:hypothetical protein D9M71_618500 [compost metagenome]
MLRQRQQGQFTPGQFFADQRRRQGADAEAVTQQAGDRRHRVHTVQARCADAFGLQQAEHFLVRPGVFRKGHDALTGQLGERGIVAVVDRLAGDNPAHRVARQVQAADRFLA